MSEDAQVLKFWEACKSRLNESFPDDPLLIEWEGKRTISQIDFVPTFSLLSATNIPFSNLGSIIPELFLKSPGGRDPAARLISATRDNSLQIYTYLGLYSTHSSDLDYQALSDLYNKAEHSYTIHLSKRADSRIAPQQLLESSARVFLDHTIFQRTCLARARQVWAKFNNTLMGLGLIVLLFSFIFHMLGSSLIKTSDSVMISLASGLCAAAVYLLNSWNEHKGSLDSVHLGLFVFSICYMLIYLLVSRLGPSYGKITHIR